MWLPLLLSLGAQEDHRVLPESAARTPYAALLEESRALARRHSTVFVDSMNTAAGALSLRESLRSRYLGLIGPFPERSPLETEVVGVLEADGYTVERLHFQSRPGHHVTANLYVPEGEGPFAGVAVACGHSDNGKAYDAYQRACALFARNGMLALIYDPVGQGERHQLDLDRHGTTEHEVTQAAGLLVGESLAKHEAWDGMRAIDVLLERPELSHTDVVGLAGNSGGGTQTVFLAGLDDRIAAATPACYVMERQRLFETIGPQDGCQWIHSEGLMGLDHADYLAMFAPRPLQVLAAEEDFFEFSSTRAACDRAGLAWEALGAGDRFGLLSAPEAHGWSQTLREGAVSWMGRWLLGRTTPVIEGEQEVFSDAQLRVTQTGQVRTAFPEERTLVDLYLDRARDLGSQRKAPGQEALVELIGYRESRFRLSQVRSAELEGWPAWLHVARGETALPVIELLPRDGEPRGLSIVVHDGGKTAWPELLISRAQAGRRVLAIDLWGFGELADPGAAPKYRNEQHRLAVLALHTGRPLLGRRVEQLLGCLRAVRLGEDDVELIGVGRAGVTALHAAYLEPRIRRLELVGALRSWLSVLEEPGEPDSLENVVPGVLAHYDLPDLERALGEIVVRSGD